MLRRVLLSFPASLVEAPIPINFSRQSVIRFSLCPASRSLCGEVAVGSITMEDAVYSSLAAESSLQALASRTNVHVSHYRNCMLNASSSG